MAHRVVDKAIEKEYSKKRYALGNDIIKKHKNYPCQDCGGKFPVECMDFDHVRGKKKRNVAQMKYAALTTLLDEIAKCDVVCANCHRIRTMARIKNEQGS